MTLSERTLQRLSNLIVIIAEGERATELLRQVLAEQKMFEPYTGINYLQRLFYNPAFKRLDQTRSSQLGIPDISDFLIDNNISGTIGELQYILKKLDQDNDGIISYSDFVNSILPKEDQKLRQIASLRDSYFIDVNMLLPYDVEWALARIFEQELKNYQKIKAAQQILIQSFDFDALECFKSIDKDFKGQITMDNLSTFTKIYGNFLSTEELIAFFRVVDFDQDGRISYSEFLEAISYFQASSLLFVNKINKYHDLNERKLQSELRHSKYLEDKFQNEINQSKSTGNIIEQELRFSQSLKKNEVEKKDLGKSREEIQQQQQIDGLKRIRDLSNFNEELRLSRERIAELDLLRQSRERLANLEIQYIRDQQYRQIKKYEQQVRKSPQELLKQSKIIDEEIRNSRERQQYINELRKSRERLVELQKDLEKSRIEGSLKSIKKLPQRQIETKMIKSRIYETPKKKKNQINNLNTSLKESPMKGNEEHHLVMALKEFILLHQELEEIKNQLSYKSDFHPASAFSLIDQNNRGQLTKLDFELAINDIGIYPSSEDIKLFYDRVCPNTSFLTYKTFMGAVLPQSQQYQELMLSRASSTKMGQSTKSLFIILIKKYFQTENDAELLRQRLARRPLFNISQAFQAVDAQNYGFVTNEQFKELFKKYGVFATNKDIQTLVNVYDKDKKGKITYKDFVNELSPKKNIHA